MIGTGAASVGAGEAALAAAGGGAVDAAGDIAAAPEVDSEAGKGGDGVDALAAAGGEAGETADADVAVAAGDVLDAAATAATACVVRGRMKKRPVATGCAGDDGAVAVAATAEVGREESDVAADPAG